jgi:hypothetical protein
MKLVHTFCQPGSMLEMWTSQTELISDGNPITLPVEEDGKVGMEKRSSILRVTKMIRQ